MTQLTMAQLTPIFAGPKTPASPEKGFFTRNLARLLAATLLTLSSFGWVAAHAAQEIFWIDVRSADEYQQTHVEGATNIPHDVIAQHIGDVTGDKNATIYLYCRSGQRAGVAKATLEAAGYTQVINLGGLQDAQRTASDLKPE